jgi:hypothetical protein
MFDATIAPVPKNRNTQEENEAVKAGQAPKEVGGTVLKALGFLKAEKLIIREPGHGTFVRSHQRGSKHPAASIRYAPWSATASSAKSRQGRQRCFQ